MSEIKIVFIILGRFFYRYRSLIALLFFLLLFICSHPDHKKIFLSTLLIICGIVVRLWSAGYIGEKSRGNDIKSEYRIINGPYGILRHPLYIGNFFLVLGTVFLYNSPLWLGLFLIIIFIFEYSLIIYAEEQHLRNVPANKVRFSFANLKTEVSTIIVIIVVYLLSYLLHSVKPF